jgi:hypothetical protein
VATTGSVDDHWLTVSPNQLIVADGVAQDVIRLRWVVMNLTLTSVENQGGNLKGFVWSFNVLKPLQIED